MPITLDTAILSLSPIAKTTHKRFKNLGLETVQDLIFYFPFRYEDYSKIIQIEDVQPGDIITIQGKIQLINNKRSSIQRKMITEALIADDTGQIKAVWFNQPFIAKNLQVNDLVSLSGKVTYDRFGLQISSPEYEKIYSSGQTTHTARLVPIYSATQNLTQKQIRFLIKMAMPAISQINDFMPEEILKQEKLAGLKQSLRQIHFPENQAQLEQAQRRLKFDELFLIQLQVAMSRQLLQSQKAVKIKFREKQTRQFVEDLPFKLTLAQKKSAWQIIKDLEKERPMNRLLEGDVGSGKTVVAALTMLNTALSNYQTVIMAPTEILARQHFETLAALFLNYDFSIGLLTRGQRLVKSEKLKVKSKKCKAKGKSITPLAQKSYSFADEKASAKLTKSSLLEKIFQAEIDIVIGTHSLIQEKIKFKKLALAIIDEQHRFGVEQRKTLREKMAQKQQPGCFLKSNQVAERPHFLTMTATPIPRSLALTIYGDLDLSVLDEMPKGRRPILTKVVPPQKRPQAYDFIKKQIAQGRQVFVICPLISESDKLGVKAATQEYDKLQNYIFKEFKIGLLHGRLKSREKQEMQEKFSQGKLDILVSTSVVEVGIDIPNASVMLIEGADRFGLAQLHQFRGRVGRSLHQSYCFLFTDNFSDKTRVRLTAFQKAKNGFELAELDLKFRGYGELYGIRQSGLPEMKIADLSDVEIIAQAKNAAQALIEKDKELSGYPELKEKLEQTMVHLE